jgi:hypothetical protein
MSKREGDSKREASETLLAASQRRRRGERAERERERERARERERERERERDQWTNGRDSSSS